MMILLFSGTPGSAMYMNQLKPSVCSALLPWSNRPPWV
jgi:hypothetical protein